MSSNKSDLEGSLAAAGLPPAAAKIISNALANLDSPKTAQGGSLVDSTPKQAMRLIGRDARQFQFPNLDYVPQEPRRRLKSTKNTAYQPATSDHPYRNSQPVDTGVPLSPDQFTGKNAVQITRRTADGVPVYEIGLRVQGDGEFLKLSPHRESLRAVRLTASTSNPDRAQLLVTNTDTEIRLVLQLVGLQEVTVSLPDGSTKNLLAWTTD